MGGLVRASRSWRAYVAGIAGAILVFVAEQLAPDTFTRNVISDLGSTGFGLGAVFGLVRAVRLTPGPARIPWIWLALGAASWTAGQIAFDAQDIGGFAARVPAPSDVLYLAAAPLFIAGFVAFLARRGQRLAVYALLLDVGAVILTLLAGVALFVAPLFTTEMVHEPLATTIALLYPVLYVAATGAALSTLLGLPSGEARRAHVSLFVGVGLNGLAFTLWLPSLVENTFQLGTVLDLLWMLGLLAIGLAGTQHVEDSAAGSATSLPPDALRVSRLMLPGVVALLAASFLVASQLDKPTATDPLVAYGVAGTMLLLATRAGLALYANYRLGDAQRRRAVRYQALYEVGIETSEEHSVEELVRVVVDRAADLSGCDGAGVSLIEADGRPLIRALRKAHESLRDSVGEPTVGVALAAIETRQLVVAERYAEHPYSQKALQDVIRSALAAPLVVRGEVIGSLTAYAKTPRRFPLEVQRLFRLYAAQAAIAISNARLLEESRRLANDDPLTGARNRRSLVELLESEVAESRRHGAAFCVVMCDVDELKHVNDSAGHLVGDEILRDVAGSLRASARAEDTVARFGGDEFVLLLPRTGLLQGQALVARASSRLRERTYTWGGRQLPLPRVSIGVASFPDDGLTADALVAAADVRMYADKSHARGAVIGAAEAD